MSNWIRRKAKRTLQYYRFFVLSAANTLLILFAINAAFAGIYHLRDWLSPVDPISRKYGAELVEEIYSDMSQQDIASLLEETWTRRYEYSPYIQFRERAYHGRFVNVHGAGFRYSREQGVWPPAEETVNVFIFGGSTTFGYGLRDDQTVASYLQQYLQPAFQRPLKVYNFGCGSYFSTQERILFTELLLAGWRPEMAIFIDGLNDFYFANNEPALTGSLRELVDGNSPWGECAAWINSSSLHRALGSLGQRMKRSASESGNSWTIAHPTEWESECRQVVERYFANQQLITLLAEQHDIPVYFVWQPIPGYRYDLQYHPFAASGMGEHLRSSFGYPIIADLRNSVPAGERFLWCADIQENIRRRLYVDQVHYGAELAEMLAIDIAAKIKQ